MCPGNKNTTTQTTTPSSQAMSAYESLLPTAAGVAATPYQGYTGEGVAPVNPEQYAGIGNINQYATAAEPYIGEAANLAVGAATPITSSDINQYVNPWTQQVVGATEAQFANTNAQQQQQVEGNAISQGAFGGNREEVAQGILANQQQTAQAPVIAGLESQGYTQGVNTALTEQQAQESGASNIGALGVAGENAALSGANAQIGAGTLEQQTQQALDTYNYQQYLNQMAYPFQTSQWLSGIDTGVGSQMGGTSQTVAPPPNIFSQLGGLATSAVGVAGGTGGFGANGYLNPASAAFMFSDRRLKENLHKIGKLFDGQIIYRFNYKGDPTTRIGLVAQEAEKFHPNAVREIGGFKQVDYDKATEDSIRRAHGGVANRPMLFLSDGGVVPGFDLGGAAGVSAAPYAAGAPFGGAKIWIPPSSITRGRGAPPPPQPPQQQQPSLTNQAKSVGELANSIRQGMNTPLNIMPNGVAPPAPAPVGTTFPISTAPSTNGVSSADAIYRRGGAVRGYDDGGGVDAYADVGTAPPADGIAANPVLPPEITQGQSGAPIALTNAILKQESGNRDTVGVSADNAHGPGQIIPETFGKYAKPGEKIDNPDDNRAVSGRILDDYWQRYGGDPQRAAVAYFSGPGNVAPPDSPTPWIKDTKDSNGKSTSAYVKDVVGRMGGSADDRTLAMKAPEGVAMPAPGYAATGVAPTSGIDLSSNSKLWPSLITMGGAMMASHSPFPGVALGEGVLTGAQTYEQQKREEQAAKISEQKINLEAGRLAEEMRYHQKELDVRTKPFSEMTADQKALIGMQERAAQRQDLQPVKIGTDIMGRDIYGIRNPQTKALDPIDPSTGRTGTQSPLGATNPLRGAPPLPIPAPGASGAAPQGVSPAVFTPVAETTIPEGMRQPVPSRDEDFFGNLQQTNPSIAATVKGLADYEINPASLSIKGGHREQLLGLTRQYDPTYDQTLYNAKQRAVTEFFAGGPQSPAGALTAGNTAILHLGELDDMVDRLHGQPGVFNKATDYFSSSGIPFISYAANALKNKGVEGTPQGAALQDFMTARQRFTEEVTKFYSGSSGSEAERERAIALLDAAKSPEELHAAIKTDIALMRDKIAQYQGRLMGAMGPQAWKSAVLRDPDLVITYKNSRDTIDRILNKDAQRRLGGTETPAPAPAAAPTPAPATPAVQKPQTIIQNGHTYTLQPDGTYK